MSETFAELFEANTKRKLSNIDKGQAAFGDPDNIKKNIREEGVPKIPQHTLDLHGKTVEEARRSTRIFLNDCRRSGIRKVRIICGMGRHSEDGKSKLRPVVIEVLREFLDSQQIKEFKSAEPKDGGYGAVEVIFK